jgi:HEPN domain-containing protein
MPIKKEKFFMHDRKQDIKKKTIIWVSYAEGDLSTAQVGLSLTTDIPYQIIAFHAQQCAEKYLKAYLVYHEVDFPYTHNISLLLELCAKKGAWALQLEKAEKLSVYASTLRYPSDEIVITKNDAIEAVEIAIRVKESVHNALISEGLEL